ncbi:beta-glucosidase [Paenibacillus methanolicus]|uniref:Beta-glucosidase n=1 Tax=Paenibacillus methanolicus TaxID=582686 RepID=A0A5S5C3E2_9BACL|nr:glycoside hydrolase family 3 C-terminal domain-containing protein [Paenibacillus methanolicus]TYP73138.1 beta-glucosidase [Paenibacillus methanolicus]
MKPWMNTLLSLDARVQLLMDAMSLDDRLAMMHGGTPDASLGIPTLKLNDGPGGVTGPEEAAGTQLPAPIALGAAFDQEAAYRYGEVIGKESRERGTSLLLGPTVNIARTPLNGRTFEGYGEDPYLSAATGTAVIRGIQEQGVMACVKHYAANNQEADRFTQNSIIDERTLREMYLPAFEAAVKEGNVASVMASYNKINGTHGAENQPLLTRILKDNWGFEGFVVSDFLATQSTVKSIHSGLDYELTIPFKRFYGEPLKEAVAGGLVPEAIIDGSAGRILKEMFRIGLFDRAPGEGVVPAEQLKSRDEEALRLAEESIVLLKNDGGLLPLGAQPTIAVIGQSAINPIASGGGSAHVPCNAVVTPLQGIERRAGDGRKVLYAPGTAPVPTGPSFVYPSPLAFLTVPAAAFENGLLAEAYDTPDLSGEPMRVDTVPNLNINWQFAGVPHPVSARWTGTLFPQETAAYTFYLPTSGASRLWLNGELVIDNWQSRSLYKTGVKQLEAGRTVAIEVHYASGGEAQLPSIALEWFAGEDEALIAQAVEAASRADIAIVFANDYMTENFDKPNLDLPGSQNRLIEAVAAVNKQTIVVLNTGGPVTMPWLGGVQAVVQAWYPGAQGGEAIAKVLFGETNPSGRLPMSFPSSDRQGPLSTAGQYPGIDQDTAYTEKLLVGYRWFAANKERPLFPFGHGLSYADFRYGNLQVRETNIKGLPSLQVSFDVNNDGERDGKTVPQLYVAFPSEAGEPPAQLKNFAKVPVASGQSVTVDLVLNARAFSVWDTKLDQWVIPPGAFRILVGESSEKFALAAEIVPSETLRLAANQCTTVLHGSMPSNEKGVPAP